MRPSPLPFAVSALTLALALACGGSAPPKVEVDIDFPTDPEPSGEPAPVKEATSQPRSAAPPTKKASPKPTPPPTAQEYPGTSEGVCQRLQDCGCPPMASVAACTKVLERDVRQARQMMSATGLGEMANALGGGDVIEQSLYISANSNCTDACAKGTNVFDDGSGGTRLSGGTGVTTRGSNPDGGGRTTASWSVTVNDNTPTPTTGGTVSIGSDLRVGGRGEQPSSYTLVVRSLDGEWVDVKVDGRTAIELRNSKEGQTALSPGVHTVEVYEFMDDDRPLARARITTGASERIVIGVAEERPVECYDPSACTPI